MATMATTTGTARPRSRVEAHEKQGKAACDAAPGCADDNGHDFLWTYHEEPHRTRRQQIIKAHPQVTKLCGHEPLTKYVVTAVVALQLCMAYLLRNTPWTSFKFLLSVYVVGATCNQNIFLAVHEISHNLAFKSARMNRWFAVFANTPIGLPYSAAFRPYHLEHHKYLGVDGTDTDLPTPLELLVLQNVLGKALFCTFQIFFYALRPTIVRAQKLTMLHLMNLVWNVCVVDVLVVRFMGWNALLYLLLSSFAAGSLHPCAGHFLSEHYNLVATTPSGGRTVDETFSYYGILNLVTYNVGYHNEHHDL